MYQLFVFDGLALEPYLETDSPNQQSVYGQTKLASEKQFKRF
jgi:dTDP-4-dehydrorhamnose reductase